jgi:hypothetical protein
MLQVSALDRIVVGGVALTMMTSKNKRKISMFVLLFSSKDTKKQKKNIYVGSSVLIERFDGAITDFTFFHSRHEPNRLAEDEFCSNLSLSFGPMSIAHFG